MVTRDIKCTACGHEGKVEAHDTVGVAPAHEIFENLGKNSATGFLHFRCPSCYADLAVDPLEAIGAQKMMGYPVAAGQIPGTKRYVPIIWGGICLIAALIIFIKVGGWWTYIVGGVLLMSAWVSIKSGLFASEKEIRELTGPGPVSEETKRKFKDRL